MRSTLFRVPAFLLPLLFLLSLAGCPVARTGPTAAFSAMPHSGTVPLTVQFTDQSTAGSEPITAWSWTFGDGRSSTAQHPSHEYATAGTFTVTLRVTTSVGTDVATQNNLITVEEDAAWAPDTSTVDVTVAPSVMAVEGPDLEDVILQYNPDEHAYLLDEAGVNQLGLTLDVGTPLILAGIEIGRISRMDVDDTGIYIETEAIPLNEVFTDGEISWDYGVEFTPETVKSIAIAGVGEFPIEKDGPITITYELGAFTYELTVNLNGATADFTFTVTKSIGGKTKGKFVATGQIARFRNKNRMQFASAQLTESDHQLNGVRGYAELRLVVTATGNDAIDYKLPVPILSIPFVVGTIPAELEIGAQFVVNASVPLDGSAQVSTRFDYDSDLGFSFDGVNVQAGGRAGSTSFGEGIHQTGASSAISANFGLGFPRISLDIAGGTLVPWAQTAFLIGGSYTFTPACQTADAQFLGAIGYDLGILGFSIASGSKTLFSETEELLRTGDCPPTKAMEDSASWLMNDFGALSGTSQAPAPPD